MPYTGSYNLENLGIAHFKVTPEDIEVSITDRVQIVVNAVETQFKEFSFGACRRLSSIVYWQIVMVCISHQ